MNTFEQTYRLGQSLWYDDISAAALQSGLLKQQHDLGVTGVTSNPAIFKKAIADGEGYGAAINALSPALSDEEALEELMVADVQAAADLFADVYAKSGGIDGFVSLEVSPRLAHDRQAQVEAGLRLTKKIGRPNAMIKIPATPEGIGAVEDLTAQGVSVNATLIFSGSAYRAVAEAYLRGLERRSGENARGPWPQSVASAFVSRLDAALDKPLAEVGLENLRNHLGIDNCRLMYQDFLRIFSGSRWERLASLGASVQRPLWASTSVKTQGLKPTAYVEALIGPHTVNTVPPATLKIFLEEGLAQAHLEDDIPGARQRFGEAAAAGLDVEAVNAKLLADGLAAFVTAYDELLQALAGARIRA